MVIALLFLFLFSFVQLIDTDKAKGPSFSLSTNPSSTLGPTPAPRSHLDKGKISVHSETAPIVKPVPVARSSAHVSKAGPLSPPSTDKEEILITFPATAPRAASPACLPPKGGNPFLDSDTELEGPIIRAKPVQKPKVRSLNPFLDDEEGNANESDTNSLLRSSKRYRAPPPPQVPPTSSHAPKSSTAVPLPVAHKPVATESTMVDSYVGKNPFEDDDEENVAELNEKNEKTTTPPLHHKLWNKPPNLELGHTIGTSSSGQSSPQSARLSPRSVHTNSTNLGPGATSPKPSLKGLSATKSPLPSSPNSTHRLSPPAPNGGAGDSAKGTKETMVIVSVC